MAATTGAPLEEDVPPGGGAGAGEDGPLDGELEERKEGEGAGAGAGAVAVRRHVPAANPFSGEGIKPTVESAEAREVREARWRSLVEASDRLRAGGAPGGASGSAAAAAADALSTTDRAVAARRAADAMDAADAAAVGAKAAPAAGSAAAAAGGEDTAEALAAQTASLSLAAQPEGGAEEKPVAAPEEGVTDLDALD
jgi:hypothetical protein